MSQLLSGGKATFVIKNIGKVSMVFADFMANTISTNAGRFEDMSE